jgi:hypothetical protein
MEDSRYRTHELTARYDLSRCKAAQVGSLSVKDLSLLNGVMPRDR